MQRPTRENLDRQIRATLVLYGYPVDRFESGVPRFDDTHEKLIADHVDTLDRLWSLAEDTEHVLHESATVITASRDSLDLCVRYGVTVDRDVIASLDARYADEPRAEPALMREWPEPDLGGES